MVKPVLYVILKAVQDLNLLKMGDASPGSV